MNRIQGLFFAAVLLMLAAAGCKDRPQTAKRAPAKSPRVASLVPAATDLLIGMGAGDHLVAVSNYDVERAETRGLPRVGDYQSFDWEQISAVRPEFMIVFMSPERMPQGLRQRAEQLSIHLLNTQTERLDDIFRELDHLGQVVQESEKAATAQQELRAQLDLVRRQVAGKSKPRVLLVRDQEAQGVVGRGTFLDDILVIAGGENAIQAEGWREIDREKLLALKPDVILHLLPEASPQVVREANRLWESLGQIPAVADRRVHILTEWYTQQPGLHVGALAGQFAEILHPMPAQMSSTRPIGEVP